MEGELRFTKLRKKEENFDNMYFESSKPIVEYHEYGLEDSNNVETKVKLSSMHRKPLPPQKRDNPGLLESSNGGSGRSSNPSSMHTRRKSIYFKKENHRKDRIWTTISGRLTCRRHSVDTLLQERVVQHNDECSRDVYTYSFEKKILGEMSHALAGVILPVLRRRLGKNSCMRI